MLRARIQWFSGSSCWYKDLWVHESNQKVTGGLLSGLVINELEIAGGDWVCTFPSIMPPLKLTGSFVGVDGQMQYLVTPAS